ncbi:hypothetical protein IGJ55_000305 [Enterococcus sp. AZ170]|uniref:DUF916 and DUF3324 domain-containing protein n=1 Tax=Enterococcus sp. AZ170 TaxID=2774747 RepID=UPI003D300655
MNYYFKRGIFFLLLYITCCLLIFPQTVSANETSGIGYTYKIIKPENQVGRAGYFDLRMSPGQKQTVEVEIYNFSGKELTVDVSVNPAKTNSNGVVEYGPSKLENDPSLKHNIKDIVKVPEKVTIASDETVKVPLEIEMPAETYEGYISGGIYLQKAETEEEKKADEKAEGVVNKYAFVIGMLLSESDVTLKPELSFNKITAGLTNYRNAFIINFSNIEAAYVEGMTVDAQIYKQGSDEILYDTKKENFRMAPNTYMNFPVNLNGERLIPGNYRGHILVKSGDQSWEWDEEFKITQEEADKYNAQDISLIQERGINWKLIAIIVGGILIVLLVIYLVVRRISNKKKALKKKKKRKKQ